MKLVLWLILIAIVLIFAPYLFLDLILLGAATVKWVFTDPLWKYFFYAILGALGLGLLGFIKEYNAPGAKQRREENTARLKGLSEQEYLDELEKIKNGL